MFSSGEIIFDQLFLFFVVIPKNVVLDKEYLFFWILVFPFHQIGLFEVEFSFFMQRYRDCCRKVELLKIRLEGLVGLERIFNA